MMPKQDGPHQADARAMAEETSARMVECLASGVSFRLEAGAGAGKTHALVEALQWLVEHRGAELRRQRRQIACITFTNVAVNEIVERLGHTDVVWVSTIHSFLWDLLAPFQKALRQELEQSDKVQEKLGEDETSLGTRRVTYDEVGRLRVREEEVSVSHDLVLQLAVALLEQPKFLLIWLSRFPILLMDEYQDTDEHLMKAILDHLLVGEPRLHIGLFGDHWQRIYDRVCGLIEHPEIVYIPKGANFRSTKVIVDALNKMRPELPQSVSEALAADPGMSEVVVWHTNGWPGPRGTHHFKNALADDAQDLGIRLALDGLRARGWSLRESTTRVLRLTNKAVAKSEGFGELLAVFKYPDDLLRMEDPVIAYFANYVEPAAQLVAEGRRTAALEHLGWGSMLVKSQKDKAIAGDWLQQFEAARMGGTVGDVVSTCRKKSLLPSTVERYLRRASEPEPDEASGPSTRGEQWEKLQQMPYEEILNWFLYKSGSTILSTKHGVKGAQYDEIVVVFGGGWNKYDFPRMLSEWDLGLTAKRDKARFERARNLFYVTVSRARYRLALLFLKTLDKRAIQKLNAIFGESAIAELPPYQAQR